VETILQKGGNPLATLLEGEQPLHLAACCCNHEVIPVLCAYGADVNCSDNNMDTPLHYSVRRNNADICSQLIHLGANVNSRNIDGETPLHMAAEFGCEDIVAILLDAGASVSVVDNFGYTPLDVASSQNHVAISQRLYSSIKSTVGLATYQKTVSKYRTMVQTGKGLGTNKSRGDIFSTSNLLHSLPIV